MQLDLRQPTLVLTGFWNPRIFGLDWVAQNLFGVQPGASIEIAQVMQPLDPVANNITIINGIGICCTADRLLLYVNDVSPEAFAKIEKLATDTLSLLKHTPVFGFGVNFTFIDSIVDAEISDALITSEGFEGRYRVIGKTYQTNIALENEVKLNLLRQTGAQGAQISVNFHHDIVGTEAIAARLVGVMQGYKDQAYGLLDRHYHQDDITVQGFELNVARDDGEAIDQR